MLTPEQRTRDKEINDLLDRLRWMLTCTRQGVRGRRALNDLMTDLHVQRERNLSPLRARSTGVESRKTREKAPDQRTVLARSEIKPL